jgi:hypothetical protein
MSLTEFLYSPSGKGTAGVTLAAILFAWPPALSWLAAIVALGFGCWNLREAFRRVEGAASNTDETLDERKPVVILPVRAENRACDMDAVMASLTAKPR